MKKLILSLLILFILFNAATAQEYFTITQYNVAVHVNKDASLDVDETINVHFTEPRHGIIRLIPYKYALESLSAGSEKANRQLESGGYAHTMVENIKVDGWNYSVSTQGDYKSVKIGSADKTVDGDQQYVIHYRMLNAINFFKDHAELYFNIIGNGWQTTINSVNFTVSFYEAVPDTKGYFVATGATGSRANNTATKWSDNKTFTGHTTAQLSSNEGLTIGIMLPKDFLTQQDYSLLGIGWLALPLAVFAGMFLIWKKWGKDEKPTVQTQFYPPENVSPSISGYVVDDKLNRRDLTALVPYWGAGGYLQIKETEKEFLFGLIKNKEYTFIKLKDLPSTSKDFEQTLFHGIFASGDNVKLSSLKDVLYTAMTKAASQVKAEIKRDEYYVRGSATSGCLFVVLSIAFFVYGCSILLGI
ncbi:MAG: DUF2207 domain-containing protein, partial [Ginsengibacter sp.]